jgi:cyclic dehypoxanthinyl futalosine synthase
VTPHCFTASEVQTMAQVSGKTIEGVLEALWKAGQRTLPGGGAEILSERVRKTLAHKKGGPEKWLEVHRAAHKIGYKSTATMMYGHVETAEDIVEHWDRIRALQDETKGFTAFIPWSFKPGNTVLERKHPQRTGPVPYLRILAASRLYLDNFAHVQASWFSEGKKTGQVSLHFGADDFGGTLIDENVHAAANFVNKASTEEVVAIIEEAGFEAAQRTTLYEILKVYGKN